MLLRGVMARGVRSPRGVALRAPRGVMLRSPPPLDVQPRGVMPRGVISPLAVTWHAASRWEGPEAAEGEGLSLMSWAAELQGVKLRGVESRSQDPRGIMLLGYASRWLTDRVVMLNPGTRKSAGGCDCGASTGIQARLF